MGADHFTGILDIDPRYFTEARMATFLIKKPQAMEFFCS